MMRCVIVDDSPGFIAAARRLLEGQGASVVGVAQTPMDAFRRIEELRPDVTLLDVHLADASGFELARRLFEEAGVQPRQMILISTQSADDLADLVAEAPVAGFLPKDALSVEGIRRLIAPDGAAD